jgi:alpha-glucosidase (family GH31 glycosyl hydrolase)
VQQYVGQLKKEKITLDIYPSAYGSFNLYTDDGKSMGYQNGEYTLTQITCDTNGKIHIAAPAGNYHSSLKTFTLKIHMAKPVMKSNWQYDEQAKCLYINDIPADKESTIEIN